MTLKQLTDALNTIALEQPAINTAVKSGNIYDLNEMRNARFGVFCATQQTHNYDVETAEMEYRFWLYYVDRLKSNESNKIDAQSTAIQVINNILRTLEKEYDVEVTDVVYTPFTESFSEMCAGQYASVTISVYDEGCTDIY